MLHDQYLPEYHFSEKHQIVINATPEKIFPFVETLDMSGSWIIRALFMLRGMPGRMLQLRGMSERFILLDRKENEEIVIGLIGQFWRPSGNLQLFTPDQFNSFDKTGFVKAVWNFALAKKDGATLLSTETRIQCMDSRARKRFGRYWFFVRPFSGLVRKEILKSIKVRAENNS